MTTWDILAEPSKQMTGKRYRTSAWVHTVRLKALWLSIWRRMVYLWRLWYCGGEVEENLELLVLLVIVWECNGLQTQTQQSTHALPLFSTYLGRIERESAPLYPISRAIAHHLILAPDPTPENLRQIHKAPTKRSTYWHPNRGRITSIALLVSWYRNIQSCIDTLSGFFRAIRRCRHWGPFLRRSRILDFWEGGGILRLFCVRTE